MNRINILDQNTANKIAAGEVVERPSSIVKELVENSIDANAKNIKIEIEEGGISLIRIIDDGFGILKEDLKKAFLPHATSKIKDVEDIFNINTLGFRGEALPSISAVSKVNFKSKTNDSSFGSEICIEGGTILNFQDVGMNNGSIVEVRDIFFNIPARRKFLKTSSRESSLINEIITKIALSNPEISITLINNNKKILNTLGNGNLKDVIRSIYGKTIYDNVLYFEDEKNNIKVYGFVGKEDIAKGSRNNQSIFVNNRYIKNKNIVVACENAFKSFTSINKFPFFTVFLEVPYDFVDVNIHPTKADIKFSDDRIVFKAVFNAIHSTFKENIFNEFCDKSKNNNKNNIYVEDVVEVIKLPLDDTLKDNYKEISFSNQNNVPKSVFKENTVIKDTTQNNLYVDNNKKQNSTLDINTMFDNIDSTDLKKEELIYIGLVNKSKIGENNDNKLIANNINTLNYENNLNSEFSQKKIEIKTQNKEEHKYIQIENDKKAKFPELKIIGQFNKKYILAQSNDDLYIIDQHAAHEKILLEKYIINIKSGEIIIQPLLSPLVLDLSIEDYSYYEENVDTFKKCGFLIENFGDNTIIIKEVPYFLGKLNCKNLFIEILNDLKKLGSGDIINVKFNKIADKACKAAIKANDTLNDIEMKSLISDLRFIENPFHCPHGRPIIIKFSEHELDKKFRRIL